MMSAPQLTESHFEHLIKLLLRRRRFIFLTAALGMFLAGMVGLAIPPRYTAKAQIIVQPELADAPRPPANKTEPVDETIIVTHVIMLTSRGFLRRVIDSLAEEPIVSLVRTEPDPAAATCDSGVKWCEWVSNGERLIRAAKMAWSSSGQKPDAKVSLSDFERRLAVFQERRSSIIGVGFTSTNPGEAAFVANRLVELYAEDQTKRKQEKMKSTLVLLDRRFPELRKQVELAETAAQDFRVAHGLTDGTRSGILDQQLSNTDRQLVAVKSDLAQRKSRLEALRSLQRGGSDPEALVRVIGVPALTSLHSGEVALLRSEPELAATDGEAHPKVQLVRDQLREARRRLDEEAERVAAFLEGELQVGGALMRSIQERLEGLQTATRKATEVDVRFRELQSEATVTRQLFETSLRLQKELQSQEEVQSEIRVLSLASAPEWPSSPDPRLFLLPALVASCIAGGMLAVVRERLKRRLHSERDITEALGIPCLGLVPKLRLNDKWRPHEHLLKYPSGAYAEAIRSLVFAVLEQGQSARPKLILVSSSVPHEGRTTLALSLAVGAAQIGRRVLLIDFDLKHSEISAELGIHTDRKAPIAPPDHPSGLGIIRGMPSLGIDVLPALAADPDPFRLLAGGQMQQMLDRLRESYECVVIDSSPIHLATETRLLASMVDEVLMVVKWGTTRPEVARNTLYVLQKSAVGPNCISPVSAVVVQADMKKHARYRYGDVGESFAKYRRYISSSGAPQFSS